jgi:SAM-dependent methyltransferase
VQDNTATPQANPSPQAWARHTLQERSEIYHERAGIYEELSQAEDADGKVFHALAPFIAGLDLLDVGCGSGKYIELLGPLARHATGLDAAPLQLAIAAKKSAGMPHVELVLGDAISAELPQREYDVAIACWMLGTVLDQARRLAIIERVMAHLAPGGSFFLVENDSDGAFEALRSRQASSLAYNQWLTESAGFHLHARLESQFIFPSAADAARVMGAIWGPQVESNVHSARIEHRILILRQDKPHLKPLP